MNKLIERNKAGITCGAILGLIILIFYNQGWSQLFHIIFDKYSLIINIMIAAVGGGILGGITLHLNRQFGFLKPQKLLLTCAVIIGGLLLLSKLGLLPFMSVITPGIPVTMSFDTISMDAGCTGNITFAPTPEFPLKACAGTACINITSGEYGINSNIIIPDVTDTEAPLSISWKRIKNPTGVYETINGTCKYSQGSASFGNIKLTQFGTARYGTKRLLDDGSTAFTLEITLKWDGSVFRTATNATAPTPEAITTTTETSTGTTTTNPTEQASPEEKRTFQIWVAFASTIVIIGIILAMTQAKKMKGRRRKRK